MSFRLETERLQLSKFGLNDTDFIVRLLNTPGWLQFIGDRQVRDEESAKVYLLNGTLASYRANGFGLYKVELQASAIPIGMCGLLKRAVLEEVDIGFAFLPEYTSKGYAYEAAKAILENASIELGLKRILAIVTPTNLASIRLLSQLRFKETGKIKLAPETAELLLLAFDSK